jgi:hypothetical protein
MDISTQRVYWHWYAQTGEDEALAHVLADRAFRYPNEEYLAAKTLFGGGILAGSIVVESEPEYVLHRGHEPFCAGSESTLLHLLDGLREQRHEWSVGPGRIVACDIVVRLMGGHEVQTPSARAVLHMHHMVGKQRLQSFTAHALRR